VIFPEWRWASLEAAKTIGGKSMKKDRERVTAEITLSHLMRLGNEPGTSSHVAYCGP